MNYESLLNPRQLEAVYQTDGPVLILAGAGSGKTRVLTYRVAYMIEQGIRPWNIMAITFTNKAAGEMRERVDKIVGDDAESVWIATFHSSCARILRRYIDRLNGYDNNFAIYDSDDSKNVIKEVCKKLGIDTKRIKERTILNEISSAKNELMDPELYEQYAGGDFILSKIAECYREYQNTLKKSNALDFDDLLFKCVELFRTDPEVLEGYRDRFKYICVDEYQDTNTAQFEFVRLLSEKSRNICVVGDDDQSIYRFRGANIRNILDFEKFYPDAYVVKLEQNYRSTSNILNAANGVIAHNTGRKSKTLWTDKGDGESLTFKRLDNAWEESRYITSDIERRLRAGASYGDFAVLYRTNAQSRILEEGLVMEGIPYNVVGGTNFYSRREIKDILAYLKTIANGRDDLACKRIINIPKRGIGATSILKLQEFADSHGISFFDAVCSEMAHMVIGRSASKLEPFYNLIRVLRARATEMSLTDIFDDMMEMTGYEEYLESLNEEDTEDRLDNIEELRNKLVAYEETADEPTIDGFLEEVALVADIDNVKEGDERVLLMTLHSAKGLEFKYVYLAGMEDGLFPSSMTIVSDDRSEMEEERRLAYVGITRAMDHLTLTAARERMVRGETVSYPISRFIKEIPKELMGDSAPGSAKGSSGNTYSSSSGSSYRASTGISYGSRSSDKVISISKKPYDYGNGGISSGNKSISSGTGSSGAGTVNAKAGNAGSANLGYDKGDRVRHLKFGEGVVIDIEPGPRDYQVTVDFDNAGRKIMYAGFAKLVKIC